MFLDNYHLAQYDVDETITPLKRARMQRKALSILAGLLFAACSLTTAALCSREWMATVAHSGYERREGAAATVGGPVVDRLLVATSLRRLQVVDICAGLPPGKEVITCRSLLFRVCGDEDVSLYANLLSLDAEQGGSVGNARALNLTRELELLRRQQIAECWADGRRGGLNFGLSEHGASHFHCRQAVDCERLERLGRVSVATEGLGIASCLACFVGLATSVGLLFAVSSSGGRSDFKRTRMVVAVAVVAGSVLGVVACVVYGLGVFATGTSIPEIFDARAVFGWLTPSQSRGGGPQDAEMCESDRGTYHSCGTFASLGWGFWTFLAGSFFSVGALAEAGYTFLLKRKHWSMPDDPYAALDDVVVLG